MFLDPQFIANQEDFQHKILSWSNPPPLLAPTYIQGTKEDAETMKLSINSEATI